MPRPICGLDQIIEVERGLAEEFVGALRFELEQIRAGSRLRLQRRRCRIAS